MSLLEVRTASLVKVGPLEGYSEGQIIPRWCEVGTWRLVLPGSLLVDASGDDAMQDRWDALMTGGGIVVTDPASGQVFGSGPLTRHVWTRNAALPGGQWELTGVTDEVALQDRLIYPDPTQPASNQSASAYDDRTGPAETVIRGYVNSNAGPAALLARRSLTLEPDLARGPTIHASYRFDNLLDAAKEMAAASGLGFRVVQLGTSLVFQIIDPRDLSATVRLTFGVSSLVEEIITESAPDLTQAVVAGQGEGDARVFVTGGSAPAEAAWGRRIERSFDRRDTPDAAVLAQAVIDNLAAGTAKASVKVTPQDTQQTKVFRDYGLGDVITAGPLSDVVREVPITLGKADVAKPVVGDPSASDTPLLYQRLKALERRTGRSATAD